jgi:flagellar operon protein
VEKTVRKKCDGMDHRIHQLQNHPLSQPIRKRPAQTDGQTKPFQSYLQEAKSTITLSKHAQKRINERNISIDEMQWTKIQSKMDQMKAKGVTDSLVVLKDAALVVNTKSNTVITALDRQEANDHVFTNINGTILLND